MLKWALITQVVLFVPIMIIYATCSRIILNILLPGTDNSFTTLLLPLAAGGFLWQLALLIHKPLEILGKTKWMLAAVILSLTINIAGNFIFLPIYGVVTAAYTTIVASLVYFGVCFGMSLKLRGQLRASIVPRRSVWSQKEN